MIPDEEILTDETSTQWWEETRAKRRQAAGVALAARFYAMAESATLTEAERSRRLEAAERMVEKHGLPQQAWLIKRIAVEKVEFAARQAESAAILNGAEDERHPNGWKASDIAVIAQAIIATARTA